MDLLSWQLFSHPAECQGLLGVRHGPFITLEICGSFSVSVSFSLSVRRDGFDAEALRGVLTRETTSHQSLPVLCGGDDGDGGQHGEGGPEPPLRRQIHGGALGQEAARPLEEDQSREVFIVSAPQMYYLEPAF